MQQKGVGTSVESKGTTSQSDNAVAMISFNRKVFCVGSRTMAITIPQALAEFFGVHQGCWLKVTLEKLDCDQAKPKARA